MKRLQAVASWLVLLGGCGPALPTLAGGKPVSYWIESLHDPEAKVRKNAVFKLGNVGPMDPAVFPALREALTDPDARVRREAILALMKYGPGAEETVPILVELQRADRDAQVRSCAARALEKLRVEG
jgi:HEAT repeat protein